VCFCSLSYPACDGHAPCYIVICDLSPLQYFSTLSHKRYDLKKNERKIYVLIFCTNLSETLVILRRTQQDTIKMHVYRSSRKVPVIPVRFKRMLNFLDRFSKNNQMSNLKFHESPLSESRVVPRGRTDRQSLFFFFCILRKSLKSEKKHFILG
jgi:hypothetical protein